MSDNGEETQEFEVLLKQITHEKQRQFLENYPKQINTKATCEAIGISEHTPYNWLDKGGIFNTAFTALKKEISTHRIELHEKNIEDVALDPKTKDQSRIFGSLVVLRAEAPDKYREKVTTAPLIGNVIIKLAIPDYKELPEADIVDIIPTEKSTELPE